MHWSNQLQGYPHVTQEQDSHTKQLNVIWAFRAMNKLFVIKINIEFLINAHLFRKVDQPKHSKQEMKCKGLQ